MFKTLLLCCFLAAVVFAAPKVKKLNKFQTKLLNDGAKAIGLERIEAVEKQLLGIQKTLEARNKAAQLAQTWKPVVSALARQVSLQSQYVQEMTRISGYSGLKAIRLDSRGTRPYHHQTFTKGSPCSMHNHNNLMYTIGLGELVAVLNGVQFRTRHNDYKMYMPHRTSKLYGKTEPIPYPDVPPEVLNKTTIDEQIVEMREWFKAWRDQDYKTRDYRKYFKPVLCYLEGMWTHSKAGQIDEPFASDRHAIDAKSFFDLQDKVRYTTETGRKSNKENFAFLPTTIAEMDDQGLPVYVQWNYKILCHPLKQDVPLSRLRMEDDLAVRVGRSQKLSSASTSRATRFSLWNNPPKQGKYQPGVDKGSRKNFVDQLMAEIPGKDNYPGKIVDSVFGETAYRPEAQSPPFVNGTRDWSKVEDPLNAAYYHSQYKVMSKDAMGLNTRLRGFNDGHLYVAYNTQPKIPAFHVERCVGGKKKVCTTSKSRVSYAIPLELIYLTPLNSWNPYDILVKMEKDEKYRMCENCTRNGGSSPETAYLYSNQKSYYITPADFFSAKISGKRDPADTTKARATGVLDKKGVVRMTRPSGIPIVHQKIPDVGIMRIRYPIMPLHIDGDHAYKTVEALTDMALYPKQFAPLYPEGTFSLSMNGTGGSFLDPMYEFEMAQSSGKATHPHTHTFQIPLSDIKAIRKGEPVTVLTSTNAGHDHELVLRWSSGRGGQLLIAACDGKKFDKRIKRCWDGHVSALYCTECKDSLNELVAL